MSKTKLKGFSLIELIIVLAIFSLILMGALQMFDPVQRIFKNTAVSEKTYSYTNNIKVAVEDNIEYADIMWVYDSASINGGSVTAAAITDICDEIRSNYYNGIVGYDKSTSSTKFIDANVYIMHFFNNETTCTDGSVIPKGQITVRAVPFSTDESSVIAEVDVPDESLTQAILNEAFFEAKDAVYEFSYALGASEMMNVTGPTGVPKDASFRALKSDYEDTEIPSDFHSFALSTVVSRDRVNGQTTDLSNGSTMYRAFANPTALSVANLTLTNISYHDNKVLERFYLDTNGDIQLKHLSPLSGTNDKAYRFLASNKVDFNNDIYLFYTLPNEFEP